MFNCEPESLPAARLSSISLDYGADEQCDGAEIHVSERGLRFTSRWQFSIGTQLGVACVYDHPRLGPTRMTLEGIVVWCEPIQKQTGVYETTLLFLELPDELKESLREFSYRLTMS